MWSTAGCFNSDNCIARCICSVTSLKSDPKAANAGISSAYSQNIFFIGSNPSNKELWRLFNASKRQSDGSDFCPVGKICQLSSEGATLESTANGSYMHLSCTTQRDK